MYHVMNRGDRREAIFLDDIDRGLLMETLGEACEKTDWQIHAWRLMSNHFQALKRLKRGEVELRTRPKADPKSWRRLCA